MKHPKKQVAMSTQVKIIYAWLLIMFVICGIGVWIFTINPKLFTEQYLN